MFQRTYHTFKIAESAGRVPKGKAFMLTLACALEAGSAAFHKAYFGEADWAKAAESIKKDEAQGTELMGRLTEAYLSDLSATRSVLFKPLAEAHATTDFPIILANLRQRVLRDGYNPSDSILASLAELRPTSNFRMIEGFSVSNFDELAVQPEGQDVDYATFSTSTDGFRVAMYAKAVKLTYQMWKNDDIGLLTRAMKRGGEAARRLRSSLVGNALINGINATQIGGSAGGPTPARLEAAVLYQAQRTVDGRIQPRRITDLLLPLKWQTVAAATLNSQELNMTGDKAAKANPVYKAANPIVDELFSEICVDDWFCFDRNRELVELAVLDDFAAGPLTITKLADVGEHPDMGSFSDMSSHVKFCDCAGAKATPEASTDALRVDGA